MSDGFDVYHKWLAIPPSDQPPNHYRLLGLGLFESDSDVIAAGADRQMAHVQTYKNGPQADLSQKLLNEIAAAKLCLLKLRKKEAYDGQLRDTLSAKQPAAAHVMAPALAAAAAGPPPGSLPPPPIPAPPRIEELNAESPPRTLGATAVLAAAAVLIVLLVVAIVAILRLGHGSQSTTTADLASASTHAGDGGPNSDASSTSKTSDPAAPPATKNPSPANSVHNPTAPPPTADAGDTKRSVNPFDSPAVGPAKSATEIKTSEPGHKPDNGATAPSETPLPKPERSEPGAKSATDPDKVKPPDATTPKKLLVPDEMTQAAAEKQFADTLADLSPQGVLEKSKQVGDGPLAYVALNRALTMAIGKGDVTFVGQIVDELGRRFTVDALPLRAKSYIDLRQHVVGTPAREALAEASLALIDDSVAANRSDLALGLAETGLIAARKSGNLELIRKATLRALRLQGQGSGVGSQESGKQSSN